MPLMLPRPLRIMAPCSSFELARVSKACFDSGFRAPDPAAIDQKTKGTDAFFWKLLSPTARNMWGVGLRVLRV